MTEEPDHKIEMGAQSTPQRATSPWTSLEIMKLLVAALTPITLGVLAATVNFETSDAKLKSDWWNRKVDKQIEFWSSISDSVDELTHIALGGHATPAQQDVILADAHIVERKTLLYSPFLTDDERTDMKTFIRAARDYGENSNDTTGWAVLQGQTRFEHDLALGLQDNSLQKSQGTKGA